jgi:23S rRNA (pseudouridine1915-N3)-methyltransferase
MKIELPFLGKTKERYIEKGISDFHSRLSHYVSVDIKVIKTGPLKGQSAHQTKNSESKRIDQSVSSGCYRIALDSSGKLLSSEGLSGLITTLENQSVKKVSFIIGGPLGLADSQLEKADLVISLSRMTFTHDMVRLLVLEQLYRAYTIKAGEQYHK